jgi:hypothetical protein
MPYSLLLIEPRHYHEETAMSNVKQFDIFIGDGLTQYQAAGDGDRLIYSESEPFDLDNPKHQQIQRLVNEMGITDVPFRDKNVNVL